MSSFSSIDLVSMNHRSPGARKRRIRRCKISHQVSPFLSRLFVMLTSLQGHTSLISGLQILPMSMTKSYHLLDFTSWKREMVCCLFFFSSLSSWVVVEKKWSNLDYRIANMCYSMTNQSSGLREFHNVVEVTQKLYDADLWFQRFGSAILLAVMT